VTQTHSLCSGNRSDRRSGQGHLVALDIDGTLLHSGTRVPQATVDAVGLVRSAGHHVVLATGRTLASAVAIATDLRLTDEWIVASNGAVTARLENTSLGGYRLHARHTFDARPVAQLARSRLREVSVASEDFGRGWLVDRQFTAGLLNGRQRVIDRHDDLWATPTTRVVLTGPQVTSLVSPLHRLGVRATPEGSHRVNVTPRRLSKASALELVRARLGVPSEHTFAIGDGANDTEMLAWAAHGVAMGQADERVKAVAATVTGTVDEHGAASALLSLAAGGLPRPALRSAVRTAP
jgi:hydroxymethylpyrimidine pyrophosphatase-like HAD family hydrolase